MDDMKECCFREERVKDSRRRYDHSTAVWGVKNIVLCYTATKGERRRA